MRNYKRKKQVESSVLSSDNSILDKTQFTQAPLAPALELGTQGTNDIARALQK